MLRCPVSWVNFSVGQFPGNPQGNADNRCKNWAEIWKTDEPYDSFVWPQLAEDELDGIFEDNQAILDTCARFKDGTAIGTDWVHPKHYSYLSQGSLTVMRKLIKKMVHKAWIPYVINYLLITLIPKTDGGERPIGIFASFIRITSRRIRYIYGNIWVRLYDRSYIYGRKGKSALHSIWFHALLTEHATYTNRFAASVLFDIVKAFDSVNHKHLVKQALKFGININILRWLLNIYRSRRVLIVDRVATDPVNVTRSIVPGDSNADILMTLAMIGVLDLIAEHNSEAHLGLLADDLQVSVVGQEQHLVELSISSIANQAIHGL